MRSSFFISAISIIVLISIPVNAAVIFQSATMGPSGQTYGWGIDYGQFVGSRFYVSSTTQVTSIGGHLCRDSGNIFGAIIRLNSANGLPIGNPITSSEIVNSVTFTPNFPSTDFRVAFSATLTPGYYAIIFGSDYYGATGSAVMPSDGQSDIGTPSYILWVDGWGWFDYEPLQARFVVEGFSTGYCAPSNYCYDYITTVQAGSINNSGTSCSGGYASYINLNTDMEKVKSYPVTVTVKNSLSDEKCVVWIDWNQDFDFSDAGETITMSGSQSSDITVYTGTITPPASAVLGKTRMRAQVIWISNPSPCENGNYGETEDYSVTVTNPAAPINISGYVKTAEGVRIAGVTVAASTGQSTATDSLGKYSLSLTSPFSGTVSPAMTGWTFSPTSRTYSNQSIDIIDQNFTGTHTGNYAGGSGTPSAPYLIQTAEQLNTIGLCPNDWDKCFKLIANIDLSSYTGTSFNLIGKEFTWDGSEYTGIGFTGDFNGDGHTISNFTYSSAATNCIALFRSVQRGNIENLGLINPVITGKDLTASLVGVIDFDANIINCWVDGGSVTGVNKVGGLIGYSEYSVNIIDSHAGITVSGYQEVGGFIGFHNYDSYTTRCYAGGNVSGYQDVGGFVGTTRESTIEQCYAKGNVTGTNRDIGGFAGSISDYEEVMDCYARGNVTGFDYVGNFLGYNSTYTASAKRCYATGHITGTGGLRVNGFGGSFYQQCPDYAYNFFDTQTTGLTYGCGGVGRSTAAMYLSSTYTSQGWDFALPVWTINEGSAYPKLWWETYSPNQRYGGGTGRPGDPYLIYDATQLNSIGTNTSDWNKCFKLMADIDLVNFTGTQFNLIGNDTTPFTGGLNGNDKTIYNFTYGPTSSNKVGLFRRVSGASALIEKLKLAEAHINSSGSPTGTIAGQLENGATISDCNITNGIINASNNAGGIVGNNSGTIKGSKFNGVINASSTIGGLAGYNVSGATILNCSSEGTITGFAAVGGLVGENSFSSHISSCYSMCNVQRTSSYHMYYGGLVGTNSQGTINNSYAKGSVTGGSYTGGLAGQNGGMVTKCYSRGSVSGTTQVGGLIGVNNATVEDSFWDTQTSGQPLSAGGTGKTSEQMKMPSTYVDAGWDFNFESENGDEDIWSIEEGNYPRLLWEIGSKYGGGNGTQNDPYLIYTAKQMNEIGLDINDWNKCFRLMADIDLSAYTGSLYNIIGIYSSNSLSRKPFSGIFDGNFHSISGFTYSAYNKDYVGLFGYAEGIIKNLKIISPNITDPGFDDLSYVGALAGYASGANISGCCVIGGTVQGERYIGGLAGAANCYIADCSSSASVSGNSYVGGFLGTISGLGGAGNISDCYASGSVSGLNFVGGFMGDSSDALTLHCYSTGHVTGDVNAGGFSGYNVNMYPIDENFIYCFWDTTTSGKTYSAKGTGLTTAQMQNKNTFTVAGWDFVDELANGPSDDWAMPPAGGYPVLWYQLTAWPALPVFADGLGTAEEPYLIETPAQLNSIGHNARLMDKHFRLISDIDMTDVNYFMIASKPYNFTGSFDGAGNSVKNLKIETGFLNISPVGFIASISGKDALIENLTLINSDINSTWGYGVGSITGKNTYGTISNCHADNTRVVGMISVGGIVGINYQYASVSGCSATGDISESNVMSVTFSGVGGIVGENSFYSQINNSSSECNISGGDCLGGLAGMNLIYTKISNCYSQGDVNGTKSYIGGLIGRNQGGTEVNYCYSSAKVNGLSGDSSVGAFVGKMGTSGKEYYTACFWDTDINPDMNGIGNLPNPNVVGKPTDQMYLQSTFTDAAWDFENVWKIAEGYDYPMFIWQKDFWENIDAELVMSSLWMYQNLPGQTKSNITAQIGTINDPMNNSGYTYAWEIELPTDVSLTPDPISGGEYMDTQWIFAAPACNQSGGLSDSGKTFKVRVWVFGNDYGNYGMFEKEFAIALLGDTNNDGVVNIADRSIINAFWRNGSAGSFTFKDCDLNCDGSINIADRSIANSIWRGVLGANSASTPCPLR